MFYGDGKFWIDGLWSLMGGNISQCWKSVTENPVSATYYLYDFGKLLGPFKPQFLYVWKENQPS